MYFEWEECHLEWFKMQTFFYVMYMLVSNEICAVMHAKCLMHTV